MSKKVEDTAVIKFPLEKIDEMNLYKEKFHQSNHLVEAIFLKPFKALEIKILCLISKFLNDEKKEFDELKTENGRYVQIMIPIDDFANFVNLEIRYVKEHIQQMTNEIMNKKIEVKDIDTKKSIKLHIFGSIYMEEKKCLYSS